MILHILNVTELPEVLMTLGTRLSFVLSLFILGGIFMNLKKPLTFDEQVKQLIAHGIIISDQEKAKEILKQVNYYRLTGMHFNLEKARMAAIM